MSLWRAGQVGRIQGLLEAQAHAQPDLKNLSLHADEDAGAKHNIDAPGHHHAGQMTAHQRIVSAPLFFPRREVHMVSVWLSRSWLSRHRFTSRHAATLPNIQVLESEKQVWRHPRMIWCVRAAGISRGSTVAANSSMEHTASIWDFRFARPGWPLYSGCWFRSRPDTRCSWRVNGRREHNATGGRGFYYGFIGYTLTHW